MKIKTISEIKKIVYGLKEQRKKIVGVTGTFDLFHEGHLEILLQAKAQGDYLIVGLNSDKSVGLYKGNNRPIIKEKSRARILSALECVDSVVLFDELEISIPLVNLIKPDVYVEGSEYGENCIAAETLKKFGGRIYLVDKFKDISTSGLIKKIKSL